MQSLRMTFREWIGYQLPRGELILNASAVDGSDFHQQHPIGIAVFALGWLPTDPGLARFDATQSNLCSAMFRPGSPRRPDPHRLVRRDELRDKPFVSPVYCDLVERRVLSAGEYMEQLLRDCFTCSPRGHGIDCHRNYEALVCKTIPLITGWDESMRAKYETLPVVWLKNYRGLTEAMLEETYEKYLDQVFDFAPLCRSHWYGRRPDVDIDRQSRRWLRKFRRWDAYRRYVEEPPSAG